MSDLSKLKDILKPTAQPIEIPSEQDFEHVESEFAPLPSDYKEWLRNYGTGVIDEFLWIMNPVARNENVNLLVQARSVLGALAETAAQFPEDFPMPRFPEPGGFLPFGATDNGDSLYWVTHGSPDEWTVAVMGPRAREVFRYEGRMVDFLVGILTRQVICDRFPADFPSDPPIAFRPMEG